MEIESSEFESVSSGLQSDLAMTNSAVTDGDVLACSHLPSYSSVGFAGSCLRQELMWRALLGRQKAGFAADSNLLAAAIAGSCCWCCKTS